MSSMQGSLDKKRSALTTSDSDAAAHPIPFARPVDLAALIEAFLEGKLDG